MDKEKELPTISEWWHKKYNKPSVPHRTIIFTEEEAHEYAVLFAKWHLREAVKEICYNATVEYWGGHAGGVDRDSIIEAYPEELIK